MAFETMDALREARDAALAATDWVVLEDCPVPEGRKGVIKLYRQALRDFPATVTEDDLATAELPTCPDPLVG